MKTIFPPIGISGASRAGKDTLCSILINTFNSKLSIPAARQSIAGDTIKKDLSGIITSRTNISPYTNDDNEKTLIRPILVEYGRLLRKVTQGRYFVNQVDKMLATSSQLYIFPDIRYAEYEHDELHWLTVERKGFLIFIERDGVEDANVFERTNNAQLRAKADMIIQWTTVEGDLMHNDTLNSYASLAVDNYVKKCLPLT